MVLKEIMGVLNGIPFFKGKINYTIVDFFNDLGVQNTIGINLLKYKKFNLNLIGNEQIVGGGISKNIVKHTAIGVYVAKEYKDLFKKSMPSIGVGVSFSW